MLRLIQFLRIIFRPIVVEFIVVEQFFVRIVLIERQFVGLQQRIVVKFLRFVVGIVFLVGQQFVGIFKQRLVKWRFIQQRAAELCDDLRDRCPL